jgi:hypothetical protein
MRCSAQSRRRRTRNSIRRPEGLERNRLGGRGEILFDLCDVVVGAAREPANAIGMLGLGAEHDDRQVGIPRVVDGVAAPDAAADVEAAHVGQQHVQQHNVGTGAAEHLERLLAVGRGQHRVVIGAQVLDEKVHDAGLVFPGSTAVDRRGRTRA